MSELRVGFIGLGNVGGQLAGNLLRHGVPLTVRDLDAARVADFVARGARAAASPRELAADSGPGHHLPALTGDLRRGHGGRPTGCSRASAPARSGWR